MYKKLFLSIILSLSFLNLEAQNCPVYSSTASGSGKACGNQIYTMTVPNTACDGQIYFDVTGSLGLMGDWSIVSALTGGTVASGSSFFGGSVNQSIGPLNPNIVGTAFNLIVNTGNISVGQNGNNIVNVTGGNQYFSVNITISKATISITTPSGIVTNTVSNCNDFIIQMPLANSNFCTQLAIDLPWVITCDQNGSTISSGTHSVTVYPQVPSDASDLVDITWNTTTCSWDISPNNDCDLLDIGTIFDISPDPNSLSYNCVSGNETFDVNYLGFTNGPNCCSTAGAPTAITYNQTYGTSDAIPKSSPFGGTNNAGYTNIPANNSGGNGTSLDLCVDVTNYCRTLFNFSDGNDFYIIIFIDGAQVSMNGPFSGTSANVCIDLTSVSAGYNQSSNVEVYVMPNSMVSGTGVSSTYVPNGNCGSFGPGEWKADINITFDVEFEEMIGTPVVCTFPLTEAYTSCGSTPAPAINTTPATCTANGSSTITNYGSTLTYTFIPAGPTVGAGGVISGATPGQSYSVTASEAGCSSAASTFMNPLQFPTPTFSTTPTDPSCGNSDGKIVITPGAGFTITDYSINNGSTTQAGGTFPNLAAGTYQIYVKDNNGCVATGTATLSNVGGPTINNIAVTDASCGNNDGTITVSASGGAAPLSYSLNTGQTSSNGIFTGLGYGNYTVTVKDFNGCSTSQAVTVGETGGPTLSIVNSDDVSCFGEADGSAEVTATGGSLPYTYTWTPAGGTAATASGLASGTYTVKVKDNGGCSAQVQITISEPDEIEIVETITDSDCGLDNGEISLNVTGGAGNYTYTWDPNVSTTSQATDLAIGSYEVTVTDGNGCVKTASYEVILGNSFYIEAIPIESTILQGGSVDLHLFIDPNVTVDKIEWTPIDGLSCTDCKNPTATPKNTTTYSVTVTDDIGCTATATVIIYVILPCPDVFVPNTFSPNADGLNDFQCVIGGCIATLDFTIFDRWGETIFHSIDQKECWDGTFRGKPVQSGVYAYKLRATLDNGEKIEQTGNITVVR